MKNGKKEKKLYSNDIKSYYANVVKQQYQPSVQLSIWWVVLRGIVNPKAREANVAQLSSMLSVVPPT